MQQTVQHPTSCQLAYAQYPTVSVHQLGKLGRKASFRQRGGVIEYPDEGRPPFVYNTNDLLCGCEHQ